MHSLRRKFNRQSSTISVKGYTLSKLVGYGLLSFTNIIILFFLLIHSPSKRHNMVHVHGKVPSNIEPNMFKTGAVGMNIMKDLPVDLRHRMSIPQPNNDIILGIPKEMLPFTEISIDNTDVKRLQSNIITELDRDNEIKGSESIFISIPSLNDPDCNETIASAFGNAYNPSRIFIGVYEQNQANSGLDCLDFSGLNCPYHPVCNRLNHIRITRVDVSQSAGPTWGRYNADKLYGGQQFILVTDSHTFFREYWDMLLLDLWYNTNNEYAIITHYPKPDSSVKNDMKRWFGNKDIIGNDASFSLQKQQHPMSYHICGSIFESAPNYMPRNANGCYVHIKNRDKLQSIIVPFWAAGFSFSKYHIRYNVKWDPHTTYIFHGEEFHFMTRAWTHGYDAYSPPFDIAFHVYYDKKRTSRFNINNVRNSESTEKRDAAEKRVNYLWGLLEVRTPTAVDKADIDEIQKYPLGNKRSLSDYWKFAGIDPIQKKFTVFKEETWANGGLTRIPWNNVNIDPVLHPENLVIDFETNF